MNLSSTAHIYTRMKLGDQRGQPVLARDLGSQVAKVLPWYRSIVSAIRPVVRVVTFPGHAGHPLRDRAVDVAVMLW